MAEILVSGCSSGFGLLTALELARRGHHVHAGVRNVARASDLRDQVAAEALTLEIVQLDVDDAESVTACVDAMLAACGRIDVLVNNAGIAPFAAIEDTDDAMALAILSTNVMGPLRLTRAVLPQMRAQGRGRIVNVSSANGVLGLPFSGVYSASKAALESMSEALLQEVGAFGIGVTIVQPGAFHTAIDDKVAADAPDSAAFPGVAEMVAAGRNAVAADDAGSVAVVIADAATRDPQPFRVQVGGDAERLFRARWEMDDAQLMVSWMELLSGPA